ncbi:hypothetical protein J5J83_19780 [Azoarcus sp. L1K30]|uniref:hypothetical protein n=1 Tax=Azoarcus sp. L1K30 TaxID=2820277 RepID=UPI001B82530F|nr:hypothetical protein [Azoarcus sp. L1K30]MBR0568368.1 hypothetical protein [Azoarcus sp. L1K30]
MTQETMMTDATATPTEGAAASTEATQTAAVAAPVVEQQQVAQQAVEAAPVVDPVPDQYADFTFEDGGAIDQELAGDIKATAKDLGLTQAQAQKLADLAAKRTAAANTQQQEMIAKARTEWADQARADSEFGGEALESNLATAKKALDTFGSPELKALLNESGLGNHPEIIRAFYRAGKAISEDRIVTGGAGGQRAPDARRLYPNSNMN